MSTSFRITLRNPGSSPTLSVWVICLYSCGEPSPYMHDTLATIIVSRLVMSARVAAWRILSTSSLRSVSFSM